jgi:hypothetical protein
MVRLDVAAIAAALDEVARHPKTWPGQAEPPDPDAARRMAEGYAAVDALLADGADPLALGGSASLLELNHIVLCGVSPDRRRQFARHIAQTDRRFYDDPTAGADAFFAWLALQPAGPPDSLAARLWARIVSRPQLFIEGNQRTATLVASFVLVRGGLPPLVASRDAAARFAALGETCRRIDRESWRSPIDFALGWRAARRLIRAAADRRYLLADGPADAAPGAGPRRDRDRAAG